MLVKAGNWPPLGESPVTTTEGARTRRGLKMAVISPSRVMLATGMGQDWDRGEFSWLRPDDVC